MIQFIVQNTLSMQLFFPRLKTLLHLGTLFFQILCKGAVGREPRCTLKFMPPTEMAYFSSFAKSDVHCSKSLNTLQDLLIPKENKK